MHHIMPMANNEIDCSNESLSRERGIPTEFLPHKRPTDEEGNAMQHLFDTPDDSDDEIDRGNDDDDDVAARELTTLSDGSSYALVLPPDVGTLFAHRVWSGSRLLAEHLISNADTLVKGRRTVELGAGTALPSLVALAHGSDYSLITDYPDEDVLASLRETVGINWDVCRNEAVRVAVMGHKWGTSVDHLRKGSWATTNEGDTKLDRDPEGEFYFDVAILSECLWMHSTHEALAASVDNLLHPVHGLAILTYAHHIPGKEKEDDAFFTLCEAQYGFVVEHVETRSMSYMWDSTKSIDVMLMVIRRPGAVGMGR